MKDDDPAKPLDELMQPGTTLMVGTGPDAGAELRPLTVARVHGDVIDILVDGSAEWALAYRDGDPVLAVQSDNRENTWAWIRGTGMLTADQALIDELWNPFAAAYFEQGRETPDITVLRIQAEDGRYWSSPSGRLGSLISTIKAKLGDPEQSGEHGDVKV